MLCESSESFTRSGSKRLYRNVFSEIRFVEELGVFCPETMALLESRLLAAGRSKRVTSLAMAISKEEDRSEWKENACDVRGVNGGVVSRSVSNEMCLKKG